MALKPIPIHGPDGGGPNADPDDPKSLGIGPSGWWTEPGGQRQSDSSEDD
jgi:hypothetical protein